MQQLQWPCQREKREKQNPQPTLATRPDHVVRLETLYARVILLAVLPTYIAVFVPDQQALIDLRMLRLLRIFRILKLGAYVYEFSFRGAALMASRRNIIVFIGFVLCTITFLGTVTYYKDFPCISRLGRSVHGQEGPTASL